jgi:LmbE family N-acetylglucosaminyl deacetylase
VRTLLLAPHQDDETLFASFLILRRQPEIIVCYRSVLQEANGISAEEREAEMQAALVHLGCDGFTQWPWGDDELHADEIEEDLWATLDQEFEEVFAPARGSQGNEQHNLIADLADKVYGRKNVTHYTTYRVGGERDTLGTEVEFEPDWIALKLRALACYRSQMRAGPARMWLDFGLREYVT